MKKLFSMILVLSTIVFAVSCAADDATDDDKKDNNSLTRKAITVDGITFAANNGVGTGVATEMGTTQAFLAAFNSKAKETELYGTDAVVTDDIADGNFAVDIKVTYTVTVGDKTTTYTITPTATPVIPLKQEAITVTVGSKAISFTEAGTTSTATTVTEMGDVATFKTAVVTGINTKYGAEYNDVDSDDVTLSPTAFSATEITITVAMTAANTTTHASGNLEYTITPTKDIILNNSIDFMLDAAGTVGEVADFPIITIDDAANITTALDVTTGSADNDASVADIATKLQGILQNVTAPAGINFAISTVEAGSITGSGAADATVTLTITLKAKANYDFETTGDKVITVALKSKTGGFVN